MNRPLITTSRRRVTFGAGLVVASLGLALAACGDLDVGPDVEIRSEDPVVNMHFSQSLPALPALADRWAPALGLDPLLVRWRDSWSASSAEEGARERVEIVEMASGQLARVIPPASLNDALREVSEAIRGAADALGISVDRTLDHDEGAPAPQSEEHPALIGPLLVAAAYRDLAVAARDEGDREAQLRYTLLASDELRATTADVLALAFIEQAESELRRISAADPYQGVTMERAERLLVGARDALGRGDPALALRRSWYAVGLLRSIEEMERLVPHAEGPENR